MAAYITQIIWASATERYKLWIFYFLNIYFVISGVAVIFHPEYCRAKQVFIFRQFHKPDGMDLFSSSYHFISSMGINVLDKVR